MFHFMKPRIDKGGHPGAQSSPSEETSPPAAAADEAEFDAAVARKLAELPPPAGLRAAILARARVIASRAGSPAGGDDGANASTS